MFALSEDGWELLSSIERLKEIPRVHHLGEVVRRVIYSFILSLLFIPRFTSAVELCGPEIAFFNREATWVTRIFGRTPLVETAIMAALPNHSGSPFFEFQPLSVGAVASVANGFREVNSGTIFLPKPDSFSLFHAASGFDETYRLAPNAGQLESWEYVLENEAADHMCAIAVPTYCQALESNGGAWSEADYQKVLFMLAGFKFWGPTRYVKINFGGVTKHAQLNISYHDADRTETSVTREALVIPSIAFAVKSMAEAEAIFRTVGNWINPDATMAIGSATDQERFEDVTELTGNFGWLAQVLPIDMDTPGAEDLTKGMPEEDGDFYMALFLDGNGSAPKAALPQSLKLMLESVAHPKKGGLDLSPGFEAKTKLPLP